MEVALKVWGPSLGSWVKPRSRERAHKVAVLGPRHQRKRLVFMCKSSDCNFNLVNLVAEILAYVTLRTLYLWYRFERIIQWKLTLWTLRQACKVITVFWQLWSCGIWYRTFISAFSYQFPYAKNFWQPWSCGIWYRTLISVFFIRVYHPYLHIYANNYWQLLLWYMISIMSI